MDSRNSTRDDSFFNSSVSLFSLMIVQEMLSGTVVLVVRGDISQLWIRGGGGGGAASSSFGTLLDSNNNSSPRDDCCVFNFRRVCSGRATVGGAVKVRLD